MDRAKRGGQTAETAQNCWVIELETDGRAQDSEEFRLIANSAPVPIWVTKLDRKRSFANQAYVDFLGVPFEQAIDFDWRTIIHPDDAADTLARSVAGEATLRTFTLEARYRRGDGEWRWLRSVSQPRYDAGGKHSGFIGVAYDVTEARDAAEALRRSEERLQLAITGARIGTWDWDYAAGTGVWSERTAAIMGTDRTLVTPAFHRELVHPADLPDVVQRVSDLKEIGDEFAAEYRIVLPTGGVRWVAANGVVSAVSSNGGVRLTGMIRDVTARRQAQDQLAQLNQTLAQQVADRTAERDGMWQLSQDLFLVISPRRIIKAANPAVRSLGYEIADVVGRPFAEFVHPEDLRSAAKIIHDAGRGPVSGFTVRLQTAGGDWRLLSWSAVPGSAEAFVIGRDVTEETLRREELGRAEEALRHAQKVESLGQLTGGVAHDFNNLLTPIIGNLDLLRRRVDQQSREAHMVGSALDAAERARLLVQRLLAFARRQPLKVVSVDVAKTIAGLASLVASTSGPRIDLQLDLAHELPPVVADASQLELALLNLCVNARDAMQGGGTLTLSAVAVTLGSTGHPHAVEPGDYVRITVSDSGHGMDEATLARAVEPFFSTKGQGKGTGLGLSMVHGLAMQLGGAFQIRSRPGLGTSAELLLPVARERPVVEPRERADGNILSGSVLLVDDDRPVREAAAQILIEIGMGVEEVSSGEEALERLAEKSYDFLLTDHMMAGMTGADLAERAAQRADAPKILIMSGYADLAQIPTAFARLAKPFDLANLAAALSALNSGSSTLANQSSARSGLDV